ncbi:HK97 family phage major capsid protein [Dorea sp. 5-2]|nr:HK97 family phage major capsid protein [Dorea sp. 5-2]
MAMLNNDLINQESQKFMQKMMNALQDNDAEQAAAALQEMQNSICQMIEQEFEQYKGIGDMDVLQERGLRKLTSEETEWYQKFIGAVKAGTKQEITNLTTAMPVTIIDRVISDMKKRHELLNAINIRDAAGAQKLVMNAVQMASKLGGWGKVTGAIADELQGEIDIIDVTVSKYTAFFIIPKDFVKFNFTFAPMWVDQYIRIILSESIAFGLEKTIVSGDGKDQFIGMMMNISTATEGKYAKKTPVAIKNFGEDYLEVIAGLAKDSNDDDREVPEVLLVVNPQDNIKKIRRIQNTVIYGTGVIDLINLAYPTKVVKSSMMPEGKATVGIAENYFAAINGGTSGIIEFDDSNQFLEDNRVYTTRVYGNGRPIDNTSFAYLDISGVEAPALPVVVKAGTITTKVSTPTE